MMAWLNKHTVLVIALSTACLSVVAWLIFYNLNLTTDYNDAMSHLDIARLVVDNMQPGITQLGSVWLPLNHLLSLPLVWNDTLWHTGLAGSLISMAAFVLASIGVYKIVIELTGSKFGGITGVLAFSLSLNMLYLQSTPLTEPLYVTIFVYTALYLVRYVRYDSNKSLIALGVLGGIGTLTRYDAWFVAAVVGLLVLFNELLIKKQESRSALGYFLLYLTPIAFGVLVWLGWNLLVFGDPLYAFTGPYSAHAQQAAIESSSGLITKNNLMMSSRAYFISIIRNVGLIVTIIGTIGWLLYVVTAPGNRRQIIFGLIGLSSIIIFNVLALFMGFSILNLPEMNWNPSGTAAGALFNVRYGILALPLFAVGVGLFSTRLRTARVASLGLLVSLLVAQPILTYATGVITIQDGLVGSSAFVNQDIARAIKASVKPGETVIMSTSSYNAVAFESGLDLKQFIHEGVSAKWNGAISQPDKYAQWIVTAKNDVGEPVYTSLIKNQKSAFLTKYSKVMTGAYANLYKLNK